MTPARMLRTSAQVGCIVILTAVSTWAITRPTAPTDRGHLIAMFDRAGIDVDIPSEDGTANAISVKVNGTEVTGTEGGMIIFKFDPDHQDKLTEIIVWNTKKNNAQE